MFNKQHSAKLREAKLIVRQDKAGDRHKSCEVSLHYPFTEKVAANIGGHAIKIQEMLAVGDADLSRLASGKLILDCKDASIKMKNAAKGSDEEIDIAQTTSLNAVANLPNAEDPEPTLAVKARFDLDGPMMGFIWNNLDAVIKIRMDRRQLVLDQAPEPEDGEDGEGGNGESSE